MESETVFGTCVRGSFLQPLEMVGNSPSRPLEELYPIVYLNAPMVKVRDEGHIQNKASAATLAFKETIDGLQGGKPFEWHINTSSGYVNRGGKWVPVLYQDTTAK